MRRPRFIARQAQRPNGLLGRALGAIMAIETRALNDEVLDRLAIKRGECILEIGFGHGRTLERAAKFNEETRFVGIDHADDMVAALARRCSALVETGQLELRTGDSNALPWADKSIDGAYAVHTIYFWHHPERDLAEIRRVLRPGGRLVLGFRERTPQAEAALPAEIYHLRSPDEVADLVSNAGLVPSLPSCSAPGFWVVQARLT